ncbi:MAG: class I SAM-dependent methyltransferase [Methanospirillaceae archaeon]|nr:class I SAM-dependent methyltransferase [Methanospirillaceae archaeon]
MNIEEIPSFLFSFYEDMPRQGPGDEHLTEEILANLMDLVPCPTILDMGCGTGSETRILARRGYVTAVDIHQPYLDILMQNAVSDGTAEKIQTLCTSMDSLPPGTEPVDLIWSEGAIYIIGFARGLGIWWDLLKPGGYLVVSELTVISRSPPAPAREFFHSIYPAVQTEEENCDVITRAGYELIQTVLLPPAAWDRFYAPQKEKIALMKRETRSKEEKEVIAEIEQEIAIMERYKGAYGYVYYIMQKPEG